MPVKIIINGYFRSLTSLLAIHLQETCTNSIILYEPLNPNIHNEVEGKGGAQLLHGTDPWRDYRNIPNDYRHEIALRAKRISQFRRFADLYKWCDVVNKCPHELILQTNRLHLYPEIRFQCQPDAFIHIIRNPEDVINSMLIASSVIRQSQQNLWIPKKLWRRLRRGPYWKLRFGGIKDLTFLAKKLDHPLRYHSIRRKIIQSEERLFLAGYVLANYSIITHCFSSDDLLLPAELLQNNWEAFQSRIFNVVGESVSKPDLKQRTQKDLECYNSPRILGILQEMGLGEYYDEIMKSLVR